MNEGAHQGGDKAAVSAPVPNMDVRVYPQAQRNENDKLLAFASVTLGGVFAVTGLRLMNSEKGPFVAMPSKADGKGGYRDVCFPVTKEMHAALNKAVLDGYHQELSKMATRGEEIKTSVRGALQEAKQEAAARSTQAPQRAADKGAR